MVQPTNVRAWVLACVTACALVLGAWVLRTTMAHSAQQLQAMTPARGIEETLAHQRAARVSDLRYAVSFAVPAERQQPVTGRVTATFVLASETEPLVFDFDPTRAGAMKAVRANGRTVAVQEVNGHVILPPAALTTGRNEIVFEFDAGDGPLNRNDDFLYTIFVPARAHEALPCFDQPDLKARWSLTLDVPTGWEAVANGAETTRESSDERTHVSFAETPPISTYLFAFAAGRFSIEQAERHGRTFRMLHRETDARKVGRNRDAIFDLHAAALEWLERYTGIPYPFGKFDFVAIPAFQFGGMEHPGAIFYNAPGLLLDESATQNQLLDRASVIAHETSHMWFGDLVTMRWFTDVWMKEVFANFMAAKIVNPSFPAINHDLRFLLAYYPAAYDIDRTAGTNPIRQPLGNLSEAGTLYGSIIYDKAPVVMRQLEALVGPDGLRDGLREYLRKYSYTNASWPELIAELDPRTPEDLATWSRAWVDEPGRPSISSALRIENGRIAGLTLTQRDPDTHRGLVWSQALQVALGYVDRVDLVPAHLAGGSIEVTAAIGRPAPLFVLPNGAGIGYGEFHLDRASLDWLARNLDEIKDTLTRGSAWITLWDAMLDGEISSDAVLALGGRALPRERDELNAQEILTDLRIAYWRFTPDSRRLEIAPGLEHMLRDGIDQAATPSLKSAYFSALRSLARTPATVDWLASIWRLDTKVPGLLLAEPDFILLAEDLAVRGVPGWQDILNQQIQRTQNPDRKARLQFVVPALSADPAIRDRFFESLKDVANRRREPWVLEGLRYLHHPLRAEASLTHVRPSLELLQEIQRTGDIFFPTRWTDATLSGYRSPAAAEIVRTFLAKLPSGYPDRLRRIVLASADELFRASDSRQ